MYNLNTGKILNTQQIALAGKENAAKAFSEGSIFLEQVLLNLWDKGYDTTSCCSAMFEYPKHILENENQTRLNINVKGLSTDQISHLLATLVCDAPSNQLINILNSIQTINGKTEIRKSILVAFDLISLDDLCRLGYNKTNAFAFRNSQVENSWKNINQSLENLNLNFNTYYQLPQESEECVYKSANILTQDLTGFVDNGFTNPMYDLTFGYFDKDNKPQFVEYFNGTQTAESLSYKI